MKRNLFWGLTALVLALAVNVASAQSKSAAADVPFAFTISESSMAAGHYTITEVSDRVLQMRNDGTNETVSVIAQHEESVKEQKIQLVFYKYGDRYILAEVWDGASGSQLPSGKLEQEMRAASKNAGGSSEVVVTLR
jgi:hypothetical protein